MAFCSPIRKPSSDVQGQTDSPCSSTFGTPFRRRKSLTQRTSSSQTSRDTLTFLSPQLITNKRGSPRISGLSKCMRALGNLDIPSQSVKTEACIPTPKDSSIELSPLSKSFDIERRSRMMSTNLKMNMKRSERRISNLRSAVDDLEEDVLGDIMMSKTCFPRSENINREKYKKLVTSPPYNIQDLEKAYIMIDHWQEEMYLLQAKDWEYKRKFWVEQCHEALWNVLKDPNLLESISSEMFPRTLVPINKLTSTDKH